MTYTDCPNCGRTVDNMNFRRHVQKCTGQQVTFLDGTPHGKPKKPLLQQRVERLIAKCGKKGYQFTEIEIGMFNALGRGEWIESKINWLVLRTFDETYARWYPPKQK